MAKFNLDQIKAETMTRTLTIEKREAEETEGEEDNRLVEVAFSSEEPVERYYGLEILDHGAKSVRLDRLTDGAPVLVGHDPDDQVGVVESARIDSDGRGRAALRFGRSDRANEILMDIRDGIRQKISVGYRVHSIRLEDSSESGDTYRVDDWAPYEISIVSIPADNVGSGVGRSLNEEVKTMPDPVQEKPAVDVQVIENAARKKEVDRIKQINAFGRKFDNSELADKAVDEGWNVEDFQRKLLDDLSEKGGRGVQRAEAPEVGLSDKEKKEYSFCRALAALSNPQDRRLQEAAAFEFECSRAAAEQYKKDPQGLMVPYDILSNKRDLSVGTATAGGHTVSTDLLASSFIDLLRNRTVVVDKATVFNGLVGNIAIPRQSTAAAPSAYWVAEAAAVNEGDPAFDQVSLSPETLGGYTDFSRKLFLQSSMDIEAFVRNELAKILAIELDRVCIEGSGSGSEPAGILNIAGIGDVAGGTNGLAPTWDHIVDLETAVAQDNADVGSLMYLVNAKTRGKLKKTRIESGAPEMVWQNNSSLINGYETMMTNNVPSDLTKGSGTDLSAIIFGNFADLLVGFWSGLDILVDPYTASTTGTVRVVAMQDCDIAVRHAESFAAMKDAITF